MLSFDCPLCQARYEVEDSIAGKAVRRRECGLMSREWSLSCSVPPASVAPARPVGRRQPLAVAGGLDATGTRRRVRRDEWGRVVPERIGGTRRRDMPCWQTR
jgi:hypothetical protein